MYSFFWNLLAVVLIQLFTVIEYSYQEAVCEYVLPNNLTKRYRICKYSCCKKPKYNKICCDDEYEPSALISILISVAVVLLMLLILMIIFVFIRYKKINRNVERNRRATVNPTSSNHSYQVYDRENIPEFIYTIPNPNTNNIEINEPPKYETLNLRDTDKADQTKTPFNSSMIQSVEIPRTSQESIEPLPPYVKSKATEESVDGKLKPKDEQNNIE